MKSLITPDTISMLADDIKNDRGTLSQYEFQDYINIAVGMIRVVNSTGGHYLSIGDGVSSKYLADWNKDVGKILSRTLKKKKFNLLYIYKTENYEALIKRIEDEEYEDMKASGFNHVVIGDYNYTIIRVISPTGSFTFYDTKSFDPDDYIVETQNDDDEDEAAVYVKAPEDIPESLSLFDD